MKNSLEDQVLEQAGQDMAREIDREILWGMLAGLGWHRIMLPTLGNNQRAIDIKLWLEDNCQQGYEQAGRDFIFEDQKDANWFVLRWGTV